MRTILTSIILSLLILACGKKDPRKFKNIDPSFDAYIDLYETTKGSKMRDVGMGFNKLKLPTIGVCFEYNNGYREIHVDPDFWNESNENSRISLIFHELGHCDLGRKHDDAILESGYRKSIMNSYIINWNSNMKDYYFDELFKR